MGIRAGAGLKSEGAKAGAAGPARAYATHGAELNRPPVAGERKHAAEETWWILLAGVGLAGFFCYTRVWPALQHVLNTPSPARDWLLPSSPDPLYTVAGVGVGWFWVLFIAAPVIVAALALLWWAMLAWSNHQARSGHTGHLRAGQVWVGEQYPVASLGLAGLAADLAANGALLRWSGSAAQTVPGRLLVVALLCAGVFAVWQLAHWAYARGKITVAMNRVTFLVSPTLGWPDLRAGRVTASRCHVPRKGAGFAGIVTLHYSQHPRSVGDDMTAEVSAVLLDVTGQNYAIENRVLTRTLVATHHVPGEEIETGDDAEIVLAPLVASWFDAAAQITAVSVDTARPVVDDTRGDIEAGGDPADADNQAASATTANDVVAARIREFTIGFVYNIKVSSNYRRGMIEGMVSDALGGSWEAEWSMASRRVRFVRCPGLPTMVDPPMEFPEVSRAKIRALYASTTIPFGVDAYGNVISWDFKASPHMLICGQTSSGKTSALMTISTQCARRGYNVVWVDPKGFDSPGMRSWPNVSLVTAGTSEDGMVGHTAALRFIADTMQARLDSVMVNPNRADDFDPIVVITDEFSNLVVALGEFFKNFGGKGVPPTTKDVGILLRTARAVGIHMAIGIQRPDTLFIGGEARDNTALRVAMGRLRSKDAAIMMFNDPVAGTRVQPGIKGRGTVQLPDGRFREMQAFYTPKIPATDQQWAALSDHERAIVDELRNVDSFWPRRVVDSALRGYDPDDEGQEPMTFAQIRQSPIVLAADRPDLDPLSERYVPPVSRHKATMDDQDDATGAAEGVAQTGPAPSAVQFGGPVDGFDDDYLPDIEDEYGPPMSVPANEISQGDLVDVSIDGVIDWKYVHAEPYPTDDVDGHDRLVIPYRDLDDGRNNADIDVDLYEVMQVRKLLMQ
ncbi:FtsK/SpoIIIE domain-containing protein [Mycobacterium sp.]|uniref:FtsK/SpoIIIE domain-containing protein n=1 Tax=Mycobacterium sp. TaxID=1785 RepID=UPI0025D2D7F3|nr:FtsK/SpoIIIE domain-containing protein [Mycobacterium sp.]